MFVAYTLGGVLGPVAYGISFDRTGGYSLIMQIAAGACALCAASVLLLGPYRFVAPISLNAETAPVISERSPA